MTSPTLVSGLEQGRGDVHLQSLELYWCLCEEEFNFIFMKSGQKHFFQMINSSYWMSNMPVQFFWEKCLKLHEGPWAKRWVHTNFYLIRASLDHVFRAAKMWVFRPITTESTIFCSPRDVVKWCPDLIKIGMHSHFGPRTPVKFEAFFQKKLGWPNWATLR